MSEQPGSIDEQIRGHLKSTPPAEPWLIEALEAVLDLHKPAPERLGWQPKCGHCSTGIVRHTDDGSAVHRVPWPCPTVLAIADALGVESTNPTTTGRAEP